MLKLLRKKGVAKKILWVITIVIIISFGIFGTANIINKRIEPQYAGIIFDRKIPFSQFEKSLLHARNDAILRYGDDYNKISQLIDLESEAWDKLILLLEAQKRRIKIPDEEVVDTIEGFDFFKKNGKFDAVLYNKIVRYVFRCEPREFEEGIRESLIFAKLYDKETSSMTIPKEEIEKAYREKNEQTQTSYILFSADEYKKEVSATPEEARAYYEQHKEEFRLPPTINIQYLSLEYPPDAQTAQKADTEAKARNIFDALQNVPDLQKMGEKYGVKALESGFFSMEQPNLNIGWSFELLQRAFNLEANQISEPIETSKGYYILKLKEKRDSYVPDYQEVEQKVNDALILEKARKIAQQKGDDYLNQIKDKLEKNPQIDFNAVANSLGLKVDQTPLFSRSQYLPTIGLSKEFQEVAFSLDDKHKISGLVETVKGYCILYRDKYVPIDKDKFEKEKEEFRNDLLTQIKNKVFNSFLAHLRIKASLQSNTTKK